jgi:3-hydroxy-9,10-secoandrosta-1,3,5(10)-triene-9,17-dione monooxygenase reductase component
VALAGEQAIEQERAVDTERVVADGQAVTQASFRTALGHFCTGVTVVTGAVDGVPVGFACQSFAAVSLEPPLVLFCPTRTSRTWPIIEGSGRFCVNVLAADHAPVSAAFGTRDGARFGAVEWHWSPAGTPVLSDALTWIECSVETVHEAGDHYVVIGRVTALGEISDRRPLLFHRGRYTATDPAGEPPGTAAAPVGEQPEPWFTWSRPDDWI